MTKKEKKEKKAKKPNRLLVHLKRFRSEYRQLKRPSKKEWAKLTGGVIVGAAVASVVIGLIDAGFAEIVRLVIG